MKTKSAVLDLDDLISEEQITEHLAPLREALGERFRVTCYGVPNRLGPVHDLRERYPWITFAQHGFEHTFAECRVWTTDLTVALLERGREMGYAPLFKPPNWILDREVEEGCLAAGVALHVHADYQPTVSGLRTYTEDAPGIRALHTHILQNAATDWIGTHPYFTASYLRRFDSFQTPLDHLETRP